MSAATDSDTSTIYVELLDEGTFVLRPTLAQRMIGMKFKIIATENYDDEIEKWRFTPGSIVDCVLESHGGEEILVAKSLTSHD